MSRAATIQATAGESPASPPRGGAQMRARPCVTRSPVDGLVFSLVAHRQSSRLAELEQGLEVARALLASPEPAPPTPMFSPACVPACTSATELPSLKLPAALPVDSHAAAAAAWSPEYLALTLVAQTQAESLEHARREHAAVLEEHVETLKCVAQLSVVEIAAGAAPPSLARTCSSLSSTDDEPLAAAADGDVVLTVDRRPLSAETAAGIGVLLTLHPTIKHVALTEVGPLDREHLRPLAIAMAAAPALESISLQGCGVSRAAELARALVKCKGLHTLDLSHNSLGDDAMRTLSRALGVGGRELRTLNLRRNRIGDGGACTLAHVLQQGGGLDALHLSHNLIGMAGGHALARALRDGPADRALRKLSLVHNKLSVDAACTLARSAGTACGATPIELADISGTTTKVFTCAVDADVLLIAHDLATNRTLEHLHLGGNALSDTSVVALAHTLATRPTKLATLDLMGQKIANAAAVALGAALKRNRSLVELSLRNNSISDQGVVAIAEGLQENASLKGLVLLCPRLGMRSGAALAEALEANSELSSLQLGGNMLSASSAALIKDAWAARASRPEGGLKLGA